MTKDASLTSGIYRSLPVALAVSFATKHTNVPTPEGTVTCAPGDAIMTGTEGENWPIPLKRFAETYKPADGQKLGAPGRYNKRQRFVWADALAQPENVILGDGRGTLRGNAGDWIVRYGHGDAAIVRGNIFATTYEAASSETFEKDGNIPIHIGIAPGVSADEHVRIAGILTALKTCLPCTTFEVLRLDESADVSLPLWFCFVPDNTRVALSLSDIPPRDAAQLIVGVRKLQTEMGIFEYAGQGVLDLFKPLFTGARQENPQLLSRERIGNLAGQLCAVERLNAMIIETRDAAISDVYLKPYGEETDVLAYLRRIGSVADALASDYQQRWQRLVYATTKEITQGHIGVALRFPLTVLGVIAALGFALSTEVSSGCAPSDPIAFVGCTQDEWKFLFGPVGSMFLYFLPIGVAWFRYAKAKTGQWEALHQDFKLLAECVRVIYLRHVLGLTACVVEDFSLEQREAPSWVQLAVRSIHQTIEKETSTEFAASFQHRMAWCQANFVSDQINYHRGTLIRRREKALQNLDRIGQVGQITFCMTLFLLFVRTVDALAMADTLSTSMPVHFVVVLQVLGLALWAGTKKIGDLYGLKQEIQHGQLVLRALERSKQRSQDEDELLKAADLFLNAQTNWHTLHRTNAVEAITGG